ncbi:hypothetical protein SJA_C1-27590 [Sphingobium indicum UT26S]|uniref:Uncharacterized protein n=1 Tax=Sphingobium indicum (strain DSM 16413 / CCM 7287 / MTCC 6362 / UT26 / NBRC 101211 / UT26S) TaxID=452662 RepID=D4Z4R1_SPHIU|nr:hypothetical protein SJA_C1-27590 [Sphingobium indicum UT26S]
MHVDSQADPAIADQCEPEFPLFHGVESCRGRWTCRGCVSVPGKRAPVKAGAWAAWTNSRQPPDREIGVESGRSPYSSPLPPIRHPGLDPGSRCLGLGAHSERKRDPGSSPG